MPKEQSFADTTTPPTTPPLDEAPLRDDPLLLPQEKKEEEAQKSTTVEPSSGLEEEVPPKLSSPRESTLPREEFAEPTKSIEAAASLATNSSSNGSAAAAASVSIPAAAPAVATTAAPSESNLQNQDANGTRTVANEIAAMDDRPVPEASVVKSSATRLYAEIAAPASPSEDTHVTTVPTSEVVAPVPEYNSFASTERPSAAAAAAAAMPCCAARAPNPASNRASVMVQTPLYASALRVSLPPGTFDPPSENENIVEKLLVTTLPLAACFSNDSGSLPPGPKQPPGPGSGELLNPGQVRVAVLDRAEPGNLLAVVPLKQCTTLLGREHLFGQLMAPFEMHQHVEGLWEERVEANKHTYVQMLKRLSEMVSYGETVKNNMRPEFIM